MNLLVFTKNQPNNNFDYLGLKCEPIDPPYIPAGSSWDLYSVELNTMKATTLSYLVNGFTATWRVKGRVKCCCTSWFGLVKNTVFKDVYKAYSAHEAVDGFVVYSPANTGLSSPHFKTIANGLGKVLGKIVAKVEGDILGYYITKDDAEWFATRVNNTKPENTDVGEWPKNPCE